MIVHIFPKQSTYSKAYLEFLFSEFQLENHIFIFRTSKGLDISFFPKNLHNNVIVLDGLRKLIYARKIYFNKCNKIIFHSIPASISLVYWLLNKKYLKKSIWSVWGGDLYFENTRNWYLFFLNWLRKRVINKIEKIACMPSDFEYAQLKFNFDASDYYHVKYPVPGFHKIKINQQLDKKGTVFILVGNSANSSNRHLEILLMLEKYKEENIQLICPLSYGNDSLVYINSVLKVGNEKFGVKFTPLLSFLDLSEYLQLLDKIDIAIMYQTRQQGLGNILSLLKAGKKVYMGDVNTPYGYYKNILGITVFKTEEIVCTPFAEFITLPQDLRAKNIKIVESEFSYKKYNELWSKVFVIE